MARLPHLEPGMWVTPDVRLVRELARGGSAKIWVAAHLRLHTQVAVKLLSPELLGDTSFHARFVREGKLAKQIESPYLVQYYDQGVSAEIGLPFIVMEWLDGEALRERLARERTMSPAATVAIAGQLARGLGAAHQAGVVHRDVKPGNVFLLAGQFLYVKLLDFGIAKRLGDDQSIITGRHETLGTPSYMSPEQLRIAASADYRSDIWALGVLVYKMLLGVAPFRARDYASLCMAICRADYDPPTAVHSGWPSELDGWFARVFSLDREQRFPSALEAAAALAQALSPLMGAAAATPMLPEADWDQKTTLVRERG